MKKATPRTRPLQITAGQTVRDLVVRFPQLRETLEAMGIDYCCGGERPLGDAVQAAGMDWNSVVETLEDAWLTASQSASPATDWNDAPLAELVDHILKTHHVFTRDQLVRLERLLQKVKRAHGERHGRLLDGLQQLFDSLSNELAEHLLKEEEVLFPALKGTDAFLSGRGPLPPQHCGTVENPIRQMMLEHDQAGKVLADMRRLTGGYRLPADACASFAALYDGLQELEGDLHEHIHLENNILFPKSLEQDRSAAERKLS